MKLCDIVPTAPYLIGRGKKRKHCKSADKGGYGFDFGAIAFGDPLEQVGKAIKKRRDAAEKYHRKHG